MIKTLYSAVVDLTSLLTSDDSDEDNEDDTSVEGASNHHDNDSSHEPSRNNDVNGECGSPACPPMLLDGEHQGQSGREEQTAPETYSKFIGKTIEKKFWFPARVTGLNFLQDKGKELPMYHLVYDDGDEEDLPMEEMRRVIGKNAEGLGQYSKEHPYLGATVWRQFFLRGEVQRHCGDIDGEPTFECTFKNTINGAAYERFLGISEILQRGKKCSGDKKRKRACGKCKMCKRSNCGKCINCLDMSQFKGPNKRRQRCMNRKCPNLAMN